MTSNCSVFVSQGTLPPPYSSAVLSEANGSLSSPVSTMTSQSSASSLAKQRQSWLDLVSQASPPAGETAVVCSVQVHSHQPPPEEETTTLESTVPRDSSDSTGSNEENHAGKKDEESDVLEAQDQGKCFFHCF